MEWREFLSRPAVEVAPALLGRVIESRGADGVVAIQLTEVEAYMGTDDPASHAFKGPTPRNEVMFGPAGHLYVYLSYGIHWCANVVTGEEGIASAVLLRSGRVIAGHDLARSRRGERTPDRSLARGPGCLGQALGLNSADNGADLTAGPKVRLLNDEPVETPRIMSGERVGVRLAHDRPWRFWVADDKTVSAYKRSPRAV